MKPGKPLPEFCSRFTDSRGKRRLRLRKKDRKTVYPKSQPGTLEFDVEYAAFLDGANLLPKPSRKVGTVAALIAEFYGSAEFKPLASSTQQTYRGILERFKDKHGDKPVEKLETKHVNGFLDEAADKPAAASNLRRMLYMIMEFAVGANYRKDNPVRTAKKIKYKTRGFRTWSEDDISNYRKRWGTETPQRIAMEIMLHTGLRRSDAVRLGRQHLRKNGKLESFVIKTKKSQGAVELDIPVHPVLRGIVDRLPSDQMLFIVTAYGAGRSEKAFTNWIREAAHDAGLPHNSSPHGLRKAACRRLAEAGCDVLSIQAITGHRNISELQTYVRDAERKGRAVTAMTAMAESFPETDGEQSVG